MKTSMNFGASSHIFGRAKKLRDRTTFAEKLLWSRLRNNQLGVRFRRQHPISNFVVDFYCHSVGLVVELDGSVHSESLVQLEDQTKENSLIAMNLVVIRFTNEMVINHLDEVVHLIKMEIDKLILIAKEKL